VTPVPRGSPLARQNAASSDTKSASDSRQHQQWPPSSDPDQEHDSPRLQKAKLLLGQLTFDDDEVGLTNGKKAYDTKSLIVPGKSSSTVVPINATSVVVSSQSSIAAAATSATVVPDNIWSNGLLDGSDVVTRYAFRKGVKIAEPLVKYDPEAAAKQLFRQPTKWFVRNVQIAGPLGWWAFGVVQDYLTSPSGISKAQRARRAVQLRDAISGLGPAIIKAGQALASRPDLLPSEYLEELQKLQDDVPRYSNELAFATVEQELGVQFEDIFELEQEEPVAAASIGQVYKARLKANGDTVAIKIQRPNCEGIIALDLYILRWWSGIYNQIFKLLNRDINVQSIIDDFGELIYREIDYVAEAANAQRFNELYAAVTDVFVPKVYSDLTTRKVLVMEWVDGFRLTDSASLEQYGLDRSKLVDTLVQCSLRQILENGFFHADPHAGNLLACADGRLCYLDFGMMSYAGRAQRNGFLLAVVHIVNRDWGELVRVYQRLGFIPLDTDVTPIEVALEKALPDVLNADISELNFRNVVNKLGDIFYTFPFSLPPFYIAIIRCLGVLEGLAIQVDPTSRIISEAYPYVASRVLTDPQTDLQEALKRLALTPDGRIRWIRLEGLLDEARESSGYDVSAALNLLSDYIISDEGDSVLNDLADQIVREADSLGSESLQYLFKAVQALAINDEISAVKAVRSLQSVLSRERGIGEEVRDVLPEPTSSMVRFRNIVTLLGVGNDTDFSKFVPIFRKLAQEPKIQRTASEIVARLGERVLSRSLRALFGLPPPVFDGKDHSASTVFEEGMNR
jgi:aarF domain-containing kinase